MTEASILDWFGCSTFRLTTCGTTIFLDAYIDRVVGAAGSGLAAEDIDRADWVLIGHSHFDHLWGAERIALNTGATIVGSFESIRIMAEQGVPESQLMPVAGGERIRLADDVYVSVLPSLHSCVWVDLRFQPSDEACLGDLRVSHQERLDRFASLWSTHEWPNEATVAHLRQSAQNHRGDGGTLVFLIETPEGSILFQDTSGAWSGILSTVRPDVAILAAAGRGNLDGEPVQGSLAAFVAAQVELVKPRALILCHHDDWLPGFSSPTDVVPIREAVHRRSPETALRELGYLDSHQLFTN